MREPESLVGRASWRSQQVEWLQKPVDEARNVLHNLVSLLLMQRRKTEALRCFQRLTGSGALCECSLKTNSR
jgi:hypothetical protein